MKISLNEIKKYVSVPAEVSTDDLIKLIGSRLVEVEGSEHLAPKYQGIYIVKVVECEPIPDTHLHLCQIDAGPIGAEYLASQNQASAGPSSETPLIQVVCGAPNVHKGMLTAWIMPGAIVPVTYGNENFKLSVRKLRGYDSHGMLAAADELDLGSDHEGIIEIDPTFAYPGDSFIERFDLDDVILDIENKSLTHRPDTFGLIGFAREVAGILGVKFVDPELFFVSNLDINQQNVTINVTDPELCPRYTCAVLELPEPTATNKYFTPDEVFLAKAGMRPVSKIVDLTNIIMLQTGQPLHGFDYDKFLSVGGTNNPQIIVRAAKEQEQLQLLDGKTITCDSNDILITSNHVPVALAGAMGGKNTEIDSSTKRIILESATFSLYHLRKTQMKHGLFSEAITRFTKGQPAGQTFSVLAEAVKQLQLSYNNPAAVQILAVADNFANEPHANVVKITTKEINDLLGTAYHKNLITKTLENVSFDIQSDDDQLIITAPYWRTDIHIKEDIIEEIGRLLGFDNIPQTLPTRPFVGATVNQLLALKTRLRNILSNQLSANEVLTYSFVSKKLLSTTGQNPDDAYQITNSISPELECFRIQIMPSLLEKTHDNLRAGHHHFTLYEINQTASKQDGLNQEKVPIMHDHLAAATLGSYYRAKAQLEFLLREIIDPATIQLQPATVKTVPAYFEPKHSALIMIGESCLGVVGEIKPSILAKLKISQPVAGFEIDLDQLLSILSTQKSTIKPFNLSKFPSVERDITLKVPAQTPFAKVADCLNQTFATAGLYYKIDPVSIYQANAADATKNLSFHLTFASFTKTLTAAEISAIMEQVTNQAKQALGAEVV